MVELAGFYFGRNDPFQLSPMIFHLSVEDGQQHCRGSIPKGLTKALFPVGFSIALVLRGLLCSFLQPSILHLLGANIEPQGNDSICQGFLGHLAFCLDFTVQFFFLSSKLTVSVGIIPFLPTPFDRTVFVVVFGICCSSLRKSRNLRQSDVARLLKVSTSAIGMYEQGRREPSIAMIVAYADLFEVSTDYLLRESPSRSAST